MPFVCDIQVKVTNIKVKDRTAQGQGSYRSRSNKDPKQRQVGSHQVKLLHLAVFSPFHFL